MNRLGLNSISYYLNRFCPLRATIAFSLSLSFISINECHSQDNPDIFPPPKVAPRVSATKATEAIRIDGFLDESSWSKAITITEFIQKDPIQGEPATRGTEARILYDNTNLYVGAFCETNNGKKEILAQNLQRDFSYFQNDMFGIILDGFVDKRNCVSFQTNPYAAQRELLVMDGEIFNREWSALWTVRTQRTEKKDGMLKWRSPGKP
ncbi:MAG: carbohydrate binding family 9 domain-containing protein [Bacteroidota bacterium]